MSHVLPVTPKCVLHEITPKLICLGASWHGACLFKEKEEAVHFEGPTPGKTNIVPTSHIQLF